MRTRVRLAFLGSRLVFQLPPKRNLRRWCALHRGQRNWSAIFGGIFKLLEIEAAESSQQLQLADGAGKVTWNRCWCGTTINVELVKFSPRKQKLVAAALLKAARHC